MRPGRLAGPPWADNALPSTTKNSIYSPADPCGGYLPVRQHPLDVFHVRRMHQRHFLQMAHALWQLGAHQVPLARVRTQNFARRSDLEPLGGAAMRLQFQFYFRAFMVPHDACPFLSRSFS